MTKTNAFIPQVVPSVGEAEVEHLSAYLRSGGWLTEFEETERFERMIAEWLGVKYCSVVNNGTVTLVLSLMALEVGSGDEVVVPDLTMIATPNAVKLVGASPVMADINPDTLCVDADTVQAAISPRTKAHQLMATRTFFRDCQEWEWIPRRFDPARALGSVPTECLRIPADPALAAKVEVGRAAFRTPVILGGQAARAGINCETCHRDGRTNPDFLFPGVSGARLR